MAHFVELNNNNVVVRGIVINNDVLIDENNNEAEQKGVDFCKDLFGGTWRQTSYNHNIRKQYAGVSFTYDAVNDVFIAPQPFASWSLDEKFDWQPPTAMPTEGLWLWDEDSLSWLEQSL